MIPKLFFILPMLLLAAIAGAQKPAHMQTAPLTYLALGDSYTIGEAVPLRENFPHQAVQLLRKKEFAVTAPEIVATTGWTTDELAAAISSHVFLDQYHFVSLLIGVNNQYRGRDVGTYKKEFQELLEQAIQFAGGNKQHVVVLSIPDYGATPFAKNLDRQKIGFEIDQYNAVAAEICKAHGVAYINITEGSRDAIGDESLVAPDGLHPSGKEYGKWADKVASWAETVLPKPDK